MSIPRVCFCRMRMFSLVQRSFILLNEALDAAANPIHTRHRISSFHSKVNVILAGKSVVCPKGQQLL